MALVLRSLRATGSVRRTSRGLAKDTSTCRRRARWGGSRFLTALDAPPRFVVTGTAQGRHESIDALLAEEFALQQATTAVNMPQLNMKPRGPTSASGRPSAWGSTATLSPTSDSRAAAPPHRPWSRPSSVGGEGDGVDIAVDAIYTRAPLSRRGGTPTSTSENGDRASANGTRRPGAAMESDRRS